MSDEGSTIEIIIEYEEEEEEEEEQEEEKVQQPPPVPVTVGSVAREIHGLCYKADSVMG
jgi:hypothetical protein